MCVKMGKTTCVPDSVSKERDIGLDKVSVPQDISAGLEIGTFREGRQELNLGLVSNHQPSQRPQSVIECLL
jgi:hypothetical protein